MSRRISEILLGVVLIASIFFGATAHALVPHEHGEDHHHGHESIAWQSLHSSLHHEDKKAIQIFFVFAIIGVALIRERRTAAADSVGFVDSLVSALRRGILPHRKFG